MNSSRVTGIVALLSSAAMCFVLGSVHAFSVFLEPLEQMFEVSRADTSLTYSLALVCITIAVSFGHRLYGMMRAWMVFTIVGGLGCIGVFIALVADSLSHVWIGYGVVFGLANGLGYGFGLQLAAQTNPGREGFAMGFVTAAYALGATLFSLWFDARLAEGTFSGAMELLILVLAGVSLIAIVLLGVRDVRFSSFSQSDHEAIPALQTLMLWLAYGCAVAAGLIATGHATGIALAGGISPEMLVAAPIAIAICNMVGSLGGGILTDRLSPRPLLVVLPLISGITLAVLAAGLVPQILVGLGLIGLIYGAVISVYPAVIARRFGVAAGVKVYGRVFTAWAVAGLGGPWLAGWLYDSSGNYSMALAIAAGISVASALTALTLRSD